MGGRAWVPALATAQASSSAGRSVPIVGAAATSRMVPALTGARRSMELPSSPSGPATTYRVGQAA